MDKLRLVMFMTLLLATLLASLDRAAARDSNRHWWDVYNSIIDEQLPSEQVAQRVSELEGAPDKPQVKENEIALLKKVSKLDIGLCNTEFLGELSKLLQGYSIERITDENSHANYLRLYVLNRLNAILSLCREYESGRVGHILLPTSGLNSLSRIIMSFEPHEAGQKIKSKVYYDKPSTIVAMKEYLMNTDPKLCGPTLRKDKKFDNFYNKHVIDLCGKWIVETNELHKWATYSKREEDKWQLSDVPLDEVQIRLLNNRFLCEAIMSDSKKVKKSLFKQLKGEKSDKCMQKAPVNAEKKDDERSTVKRNSLFCCFNPSR